MDFKQESQSAIKTLNLHTNLSIKDDKNLLSFNQPIFNTDSQARKASIGSLVRQQLPIFQPSVKKNMGTNDLYKRSLLRRASAFKDQHSSLEEVNSQNSYSVQSRIIQNQDKSLFGNANLNKSRNQSLSGYQSQRSMSLISQMMIKPNELKQ